MTNQIASLKAIYGGASMVRSIATGSRRHLAIIVQLYFYLVHTFLN